MGYGAVGDGQGDSLSLLPVPCGHLLELPGLWGHWSSALCEDFKVWNSILTVSDRDIYKNLDKKKSVAEQTVHVCRENQALVKLLAEFCSIVL